MTKPLIIELQTAEGVARYEILRTDHSRGYPIYDTVFFCPVCFKLWARMTWEPKYEPRFEGGSHRPFSFNPHVPQMVSCTECKWTDNWRTVPGSLLDNDIFEDWMDLELLDLLPEELVRREFNLTLESLK